MNGSWKKPLNPGRGLAVELAVLVQPTHGEPMQKRKPLAVFFMLHYHNAARRKYGGMVV